MSDLIERVARAIVSSKDGWPDEEVNGCKLWELYEEEARAAILATLEWFSEPGNVTENMALELFMIFPDTAFGSDCNKAIANAMRAALEEMSK